MPDKSANARDAPLYQLEADAAKQTIFPQSRPDYTVFGSLYIPKMVLSAKKAENYLTSDGWRLRPIPGMLEFSHGGTPVCV
jgi:hypothetical protein